MNRIHQAVFIAANLALCWLAMQIVHEAGHVLGAVFSGGQVEQVVLHPLAFSRTDINPNPHPLAVVWFGPLTGVILPVLLFLVIHQVRLPGVFLYQFFAGFCLIANGLYLAVGSFEALADAGDMLRYGSPRWLLILFGAITVPLGFYLWNGLGPNFGLGKTNGKVSLPTTIVILILLTVIIIAELVLSHCQTFSL